ILTGAMMMELRVTGGSGLMSATFGAGTLPLPGQNSSTMMMPTRTIAASVAPAVRMSLSRPGPRDGVCDLGASGSGLACQSRRGDEGFMRIQKLQPVRAIAQEDGVYRAGEDGARAAGTPMFHQAAVSRIDVRAPTFRHGFGGKAEAVRHVRQ